MPEDSDYPEVPSDKQIVLLTTGTLQKWVDADKRARPIKGDESISTEETAEGTRLKFALPESPGDGTFVLGIVDGELTWLETDTCS